MKRNLKTHTAVLGSVGARLTILLCTLLVVLINTRVIGIEAQGVVGLINFCILLVAAISNFIGGGANVYLTSRLPNGAAFYPSIVWSLVSALGVGLLALIFPIVPKEYLLHALALGWMQAMFTFLLQISLGRKRVNSYTAITAAQAIFTTAVLALLVFVFHWNDPFAFVVALYTAFGATLILTVLDNVSYIKKAQWHGAKETVQSLFQYGKYAQGGNILHLINLRLPVVFLNQIPSTGLALAGIYSLLLYAAEAIWMVGKSLSVVLYATVANASKNDTNTRHLTNKYIAYSVSASALACLVFLFIPDSFYAELFRTPMDLFVESFLLFIPGILANSASIVLAHYFSGHGEYQRNMWASGIGLVGTLVMCALFIPTWGVHAAVAGASMAFALQLAYFLFHYRNKNS